ncbi:MAG: MarR family transcriptional regulator [Caulobacterales bacterium 32-69-10]|nr:MAG: MarR family transcriptional regulator [Caulobacterales bacterium 32-69-10]
MSTAGIDGRGDAVWVGYQLKITQHLLRQRLDAELSAIGVTAPQNAALLAIAANAQISNASLARTAFVTPQSMQGILVNLERAGLIVRSPHPDHGRIIMTELTQAGRRVVEAGTIAADTVERQMLSGLSGEEARLLGDLLRRCAAALERADPEAGR